MSAMTSRSLKWACAALVFTTLQLGCRGGPASRADDAEALARAREAEVFEVLCARMTGSFSSAAQARQDPEYREIVLHMVPIWTGGPGSTGERWFYVEQAAAGSEDRPYRQRVYRLRAFGRGGDAAPLFLSEVYTLPGDPLAFAGAWRDPGRLGRLGPGDLVLRDGCGLVLRAPAATPMAGDAAFRGSTLGRGCPSDLRGASYATSEAAIFADRLETWDQGFDAKGQQVWGAVKGPYVFARVTSPASR